MWEGGTGRMKWQDGSITVFLTLIFALLLALVTAAIENARFHTANSYMLVAADSAIMTVLGNYNKELYEEYGFFAYGGYDGIGLNTLLTEFEGILGQNLREAPEDTGEQYAAVYRICNLASEACDTWSLTDREVFYQQVESYLASEMLSDFADRIVEQYQKGTEGIDRQELQKGLDTTSRYERGEYALPEATGTANPAQAGEEEGDTEEESENEPTDHAGGNPLKTFRKLVRDGMLSLVCDEKSLAEGEIEAFYSRQKKHRKQKDQMPESTADYLKEFLGTENLLSHGAIEGMKRKGELICYADRVFGCYGKKMDRTVSYGMEYLVSGNIQEKDNMQEVIIKLLLLRTLVNFLYVQSDSALQKESMATATAIAAVFAIPELVKAVQQTILLILSVEESFIDITALLEGRSIPLIKSADTFQMTYPEICSASKALFQQKAKKYSKSVAGITSGYMKYQHYLMILMMTVSEKNLRLRSYDLIQLDLRERYNQSFSMEQSICGLEYQIRYDMPFIWGNLLQHDGTGGMVSRTFSSSYCYH